MKDYRVFIIGHDGRVVGRHDLFCLDDEAAKAEAAKLLDDHVMELWHRDQKIAEFNPAD